MNPGREMGEVPGQKWMAGGTEDAWETLIWSMNLEIN
jgi:hypothetical protein